MLWAASKLFEESQVTCFLALASEKYRNLVENILAECSLKWKVPKVIITYGQTYQTIVDSRLVFVTSGTATLETALLQRPMVVFYRVPKLHRWLVKNTSFLKCKYIALPNIICGKEIVPENVFSEENDKDVLESAIKLWKDSAEREDCFKNLEEMRKKLGEPGAAKRTAMAIVNVINNSKKSW